MTWWNKKCDLCGKECESYTYYGTDQFLTLKDGRVKKINILCPDCWKEVKEMFEGEKRDH